MPYAHIGETEVAGTNSRQTLEMTTTTEGVAVKDLENSRINSNVSGLANVTGYEFLNCLK